MSVVCHISIGTNLGNLVHNLHRALVALAAHHTTITATSHLYRTAPMYRSDQPVYLNCAVQLRTALAPRDLLHHLQSIERQLGRVQTVRYGERVIDLDIVDYNSTVYNDEHLCIPHPRMCERMFVLQPLCDINPQLVLPHTQITAQTALQQLTQSDNVSHQSIQRVLPLHNFDARQSTYHLLPVDGRTYIMGILNVTEDSFSDGGLHNTLNDALVHCDQMVSAGVDIVDIGGESTRPGSSALSSEQELERILPVIDAVRRRHPTLPISVDTYHANTAHTVRQHGVQLINDVSAGTIDADMHDTAAASQLLYCGMHMRGTPQTMTDSQYTQYSDLVADVNSELSANLHHAMSAGVYRWNLLADPGLGFAKTAQQSLHLLARIQQFAPLAHVPVLVGASRKRLIAQAIANKRQQRSDYTPVSMQDRIDGTMATIAHCVRSNVPFVRVHDVMQARNVIDVMQQLLHEHNSNGQG